MIKFLRSYVGSKSFWVPKLDSLQGKPFVELFAGSAALSANLASHAHLTELDPYIADVLAHFDEQIVFDNFTREHYYQLRELNDWHKFLTGLQAMSFSGVFRYSYRKQDGAKIENKFSPSGYVTKFNVPAKKNLTVVHPREQYEEALKRWNDLSPTVVQGTYEDMSVEKIRAWADSIGVAAEEVVIVSDPPYEDSQANYNNTDFDYERYWQIIDSFRAAGLSCVVFDRKYNLERQGYVVDAENARKMRVNGARPGDVESMVSFGSACSGLVGNGVTFLNASMNKRSELAYSLLEEGEVSNKLIRERFNLDDSYSIQVSQALNILKNNGSIEKSDKPKYYRKVSV